MMTFYSCLDFSERLPKRLRTVISGLARWTVSSLILLVFAELQVTPAADLEASNGPKSTGSQLQELCEDTLPDHEKTLQTDRRTRSQIVHNYVIRVAVALPQKQKQQQNRPRRRNALPRNVRKIENVVYAEVDGFKLLLDIYVPSDADEKKQTDAVNTKDAVKSRPLIVWVHGGAWRAGNKNHCPAIRFVQRGYVVASINYRLSQRAIYPAQIHDCKAAIRWLRANAAKYQIDPKRIGAWGSSAGGHLVALLGTTGDVKELEGEVGTVGTSSRVQAVCDFFGPTDFLQMDRHAPENSAITHDAPNSPESQLVGGPIQENSKAVQKANPITYVTKDDPPFLIVHGNRDRLVPVHQSRILQEAMKKQQVDASYHEIDGAGHGFGANPKVRKLVEEFFDAKLKKSK